MRARGSSTSAWHRLPAIAAIAATLLVFWAEPTAAATRLKVTVYQGTMSGPRVAGATVCLGALGRSTSTTGEVVFETVADGTHTLSAWKSGFSRATSTLLVNQNTAPETSRVLLLQAGTGTAACQVGSTSSSSTTVSYTATPIVPISPTTTTSSSLNPTGRATQIYAVRADLAAKEAKTQGFVFSVNGNSQGEPGNLIYLAESTIYLDPRACGFFGSQGLGGSPATFNLFVGRTLKSGWAYYNLDIDSSQCSGCSVQWITPPAGSSLAMTIRVTFGPVSGGYTIKTIRLKGPAGRTWQEAFAR